MSLERTPPSLPPETSREHSQPPAGGLAVAPPEKSYLSRLFEYAGEKTREHQKMELIATAIVTSFAALVGGSAAGIASGIAAAFLTLAGMLVVIFFIHLVRAPKALDKQLREQLRLAQDKSRDEIKALTTQHETDVAALKTEVGALQAKLSE